LSINNTIILCAGKIDYTRLPIGSHQSNATIPINGKPVISWILDDLIRKEIEKVTVVIRSENKKLREVLEKHYHKRMDITIAEVDNPQSILDSLTAGLQDVDTAWGTRIILGDTLIYDNYHRNEDFVYTSQVADSENWCIAETNAYDTLTSLTDKKALKGESFTALCGYYSFIDTTLFKSCIEQAKQQGYRELSSVLMGYNAVAPLKAIQAQDWFDFGHMETFIASKKSLLRPRHFNQLVVHPLYNTITKVSENNDKLADELSWYLLLPEALQILTPRILKKETGDGKISITQEFYGYPSLSELYVYGDLSLSVWKSIVNYLFDIHKLFLTHTQPAVANDSRDIYLTKTLKRIDSLQQQNNYWKQVWGYDTIIANGKKLHNYSVLLAKFKDKIEALCSIKDFTIIHGDYCLSNILYDVNNQIVRLIDPRGSFGAKGVYGDPRYDVAKLRHSISGCYDYIVGDLFYVEDDDNSFTFSIFNNPNTEELAEHLDKQIAASGYSIEDIKLIEGLLFLSMLPYHADYFERQKMMYLQGLFILNELCD
jgi:dTDP-glucose pyrophosphorylase